MTTVTMSHWPARALTPLLATTVGGVLRAAAWRAPDRVEQLADDAVGETLLQREPAGRQDPRAPRALGSGAPAGRPEQRGLADPGRTLHQRQGAVPGLGRRDGGGQRRQLRIAFEYDLLLHLRSA